MKLHEAQALAQVAASNHNEAVVVRVDADCWEVSSEDCCLQFVVVQSAGEDQFAVLERDVLDVGLWLHVAPGVKFDVGSYLDR